MTKVLTLRLDAELLGRAEARAACLGLDRAKYVRSLIEGDIAAARADGGHRFASEDLAGMYEGTSGPADNQSVRERMGRRISGTNE